MPIVRGPRGGVKISPKFAEWLMGLESGWVTDVPGLSLKDMLERLGNGVVPQQALHAFRHLKSALDTQRV
ncbi:hypothetical protein [Streptomyces sp. NPDC059874]|uniref:hypothetical protein n=1 Tax=Streptomyces sp. NPDC059874 TaxID=3346983 RepID=UPI00365998B9